MTCAVWCGILCENAKGAYIERNGWDEYGSNYQILSSMIGMVITTQQYTQTHLYVHGTSSQSHWQQVEERKSAETCGLDDVFPRDDLCFRPEALCIYIYIYIIFYISYVFFGLPIVSYSLMIDNSFIPGCLWFLAFVLNNTLILGIWCSTIPHLPGCFCPWTFFQNMRFHMVPSDPCMSHLAIQLGYSAGEFQALQLIVLATFGVGKWLIHNTKRRKDNQLQSLKLPCRIFKLSS